MNPLSSSRVEVVHAAASNSPTGVAFSSYNACPTANYDDPWVSNRHAGPQMLSYMRAMEFPQDRVGVVAEFSSSLFSIGFALEGSHGRFW